MPTIKKTIELPELHPNQQAILDGSARFNVLACGRRYGKTLLGETVAAEAALDGAPVGWFTPKYKLLKESWRDLSYMLAPAIRRIDNTEKRMELHTGGVIEGWSFDRDSDAGRSRKYGLAIIDEASLSENLEETWRGGIRPTLADFKGQAWFLFSPRGKNFAHTLHLRGLDRKQWPAWRSWTRTTYDNPYIDPAEIDEARADLGEKFFAQEYLAEFLDDLFDILLLPDWLDLSVRSPHAPAGPKRQAIDLGGGTGGDRSVSLVRDDNGTLEIKHSRDWKLEQTATIAALACQRWGIGPNRTSFDQAGLGLDFAHRLKAVGVPGPLGYVGGAKGGERFMNLRAASAWLMRQRFDPTMQPGRPQFAVKPEHMSLMRRELEGLRWTINNDRRIQLEDKEEMAARIGGSPDFADTLIQSFAFPA